MDISHLWCFGLGYTAAEVCNQLRQLHPNSGKISGTHRAINARFNEDGVELHNYEQVLKLPETISHILVSIPPKENGDLVLRDFIEQIKRLPELKWIGYLSTTGVYGDYKGNYVDENSPINAINIFSRNRAKAEEEWLSAFKGFNLPVHIFRLGGIYGQGRSVIDKIRKKEQVPMIDKPNQFFSRIHVEDLANILLTSMHNPTPGEVYNIVDDHPSSSLEVNKFAFELFALPVPKTISLEEAQLSEMGRVFYSESRRVKNDKVKKALNITLKYPSYKEGLRSLF